MTELMNSFMLGMLTMAAVVVGMFLMRFWRKTRDRLFLFFASAFWLLGLNWLCLAMADRDEPQTALYTVRLVAFGLIIFAIWDKNRRGR